jgi:hypothetical protein
MSMRHVSPLALFALAILAGMSPRASVAQDNRTMQPASSRTRLVVSYEISAALVTNRSPADWSDAMPQPLLDEMASDDHFASIDVGGSAGNGILIRFDFDDMETYREWNDRFEVQQMLAEIRQVIGYGYSRSGISMRRVAGEPRTAPATTRPRTVPNVPVAPPPPVTRATVQMATRTP